MIAFTPRFQALALALIMVVNAAPIRRDATTASSAPVATATPIVKQEYINRLPVFVQAQAQASATSSTSARPSSTAAMGSQGAQIAKAAGAPMATSRAAMGSSTKPAASSPTAQGVKVAAKATTGASTATTRAAMGSSTQPAASSPTAQGISIDVDPLVKIAIREPHHHHHNDGHHREKIIVNGDHDVVEARSPHHHHDHHDHDDYHREKVIVNGDHDHVEARSPHHHHHDHHGEKVEKVVINGDHDRVDLRHSRREHTYDDEPEVAVHGHDDHVETGDKHVDTRRALWTRDNAVPGTIQLVNGSSVAVASLVVDRSNASAPVLAASEQNSTQVRLVFMSPDDFSAAGMNGSSLTETEVPVQMQIEAFNPISAVTGVVGNVLQTLCATLGAVDSILALLGLELCPHQASAKSLFAFDTNTGTLRPFSGGQIVMGTNGTAGSMSMSVKDMSGNATEPNPAMTLVFTPSAIQLQLHDNSTMSDATAQDVSQEDDQSSYVSAKAAPSSASAEAASKSVAAKAASTKSSSSSSTTSTPVRRRFTREY